MTGKYRLSTLGCKVNQYESEQVRELLASLGLHPASEAERPDLVIVNTCAVTAGAAAKSRQAIRRLGCDGTPIIVIGCYASAAPDALRAIGGVVSVLGHETDVLERLGELVPRLVSGQTPERQRRIGDTNGVLDLGRAGLRPTTAHLGAPPGHGAAAHPAVPEQVNTKTTTTNSISARSPDVNSKAGLDAPPAKGMGPPIHAFADHTRAFVKVQDGCDACCTYCIIPRLRTAMRSKSVDEVASEIASLVQNGYSEIVLTGIYLGAYGRDTALRRKFKEGPSPLSQLVSRLASTSGLRRLRLSSLEPGDVDDALLEVMAREEACVAHLHLPLQSGSHLILKRMARQYTVSEYLSTVDRVKQRLDHPAITTDVIVGFPGETEAMFEETLDVVRRCGFSRIHAFPYSPRPGTAATRWKDYLVPRTISRERIARLRALGKSMSYEFHNSLIGRQEKLLVEDIRQNKTGEKTQGNGSNRVAYGHSDRYVPVTVSHHSAATGDVLTVHVEHADTDGIYGRVV